MKDKKNIKVCHFSSVHSIYDTRVYNRECVSMAKYFDVTLIAIGSFTGTKNGVKIIGINKTTNKLNRIFVTTIKVFAQAIKTDAQIYHIHDAEMLPFALLLVVLGKKVIYDIHENTKQDILLKPWISPLIKNILANTYDALLKLSSSYIHYITVLADEKFLPIFYAKKNQYTIVQNFANVEDMLKYRVEDRWNLQQNHIFYVGMIKDIYYNFDLLIDSVYELKQQNYKVYIHVVGYFGTNVVQHFNNNKNWKEVKEQIHFYGKLDMDTAYRISMQCKLGICLKNQPENILLSHERKFFEYLAVGLPSVFCNAKIYTDINKKYNIGIGVDLGNKIQIAQAIKSILSNEIEYKQMQQNCVSAVNEKYNWKSQEEILLNLYTSLCVSI